MLRSVRGVPFVTDVMRVQYHGWWRGGGEARMVARYVVAERGWPDGRDARQPRLFTGALAVFAPRPATRSTLAGFEFFLRAANAALSGLLLLGIFDPTDELVASQWRDVLPRFERR